jgi:hypothetical protein
VRMLKTLGILAIGWGMIAIGAAFIPLPGPGIPVLLCGVAVLSLRSARARWLFSRCREYLRSKWPDSHARLERFRILLSRWVKG